MTHELTQSQTAEPLVFLMVDSALHIAGKTSLSPTVTISKNGGAFGAPAGSVSELANGWYKVAGNATDTDTLGPLILHAEASGADPVDLVYQIVAQNRRTVSMGLVLAKTTNLTGLNDIAATAIVSSGAITTNGGAVSSVTDVTNLANAPTIGDFTAAMKSSITTAATAATPTAAAVTGDVGGKVLGGGAGTITGTGVQATISGTLTTLDALWAKIQKWLRLALRKDAAIVTDHATELAEINANGGSGAGAYANTTDSQEALRDTEPMGTAMRGTDGALLAGSYTAPDNTSIGNIKTVIDKLDTALVADGLVYQFTVNALELAPGTSGTVDANVVSIASQTASAAAPVAFPAAIGTSTYAGADTPGTTTLLGIFTGITSLPAWLRGLFRKSVMDVTAKAEVNSGGGTYDETTDSNEAIRDTAPLGTAMRGTDGALLAASYTAPDNTNIGNIKAVTDKLDTAVEADGLVYRFTANALENGPTTPGAPTVAQIDAQLTSTHGAGSWGTAMGASSKVYTVTVDGAPGAGVYCRMTTDVAGLNNVDAGTTDALGEVTFHHDLPAGTTVYIWRVKTGVLFVDPDVEVI